ncbi:MAG: hypothetical protein JSV52_03835 [Candidatus Zixiibacteriota bacterium]|nr:MAG: hypothetical protein JSV52_03835 [candidate division Zixibacteria bacterium]
MATTTATPKSGFYVEVTCPGCGSALNLESDFFVLRCDHCSSVHRVILPEVPSAFLIPAGIERREARFSIDRYLKQQGLPLTGSGMHLKQLYYPYWKVDAILFRLRNKVYEKVVMEEGEYNDAVTVSHDRTEISLSPYTTTRAAGVPFEGIPASIGMRTEYIKMVPFARENVQEEFDSFPVLSSWEDVRSALLMNVGVISDIDLSDIGSNVTELFHPKASLVYFPYLVMESYSQGGFNRYVVDGVSGRVLDHVTAVDSESQFEYPEAPTVEFGALTVEHHRCPTCGVDLPARQSYVYICRNCHELIVLCHNREVVSELHAAVVSEKNQDPMFPFWSLRVPEDRVAQLQKMFGGIHRSDRLIIPAFKSQNFDALFRLTKRMSAAIPQLELESLDKLDDRFLPVTVSPDEATMMTEVIIYRQGFSGERKTASEPAAFVPEDIGLVYVPFHPEHYFYVDSIMNVITFEKSLAR